MKHLSLRNALIVVLAILCFWQWKCSGEKKGDTTIKYIPTKDLVDSAKIIAQVKKKMDDSFDLVLKKHYDKDYQNENYLIELANQNSELSAINNRLQSTETYPDTCEHIVSLWKNQYQTYVTQTGKLIEQGKVTINGLHGTIATQKDYITEEKRQYAILKSLADTCLSNSQKIENALNKSKPRSSIYIGATGIGSALKIYEGAGINLGLETKKQMKFEIGVLQMNNTYHYTIGIKKTLFKL